MSEPLVSIILTSYNREHTIPFALETVRRQTYSNYELICSDDASTDRTLSILEEFPIDNKVILTADHNQGIPKNRNKALSACKGKYIAILDSDDGFYPEKLAAQVAYLEAHPDCDMVIARPQLIGTNNELLSQKALSAYFVPAPKHSLDWLRFFYFKANCICNSGTMLRRECFDALGPYDETLLIGEDFDLWIRFFLSGRQAYLMDDILSFCRLHQNRITFPRADEYEASIAILQRILYTHFYQLEDPDLLRQIFPEIPKNPLAMMRYDLATLSKQSKLYVHHPLRKQVVEELRADVDTSKMIDRQLRKRQFNPFYWVLYWLRKRS